MARDNRNLDWGESHEGKRHSIDSTCPNYGCERNADYAKYKHDYYKSMAIGVKFQGLKKDYPYVLTLECLECSEKFWFHIGKKSAKKFKR